MELKRLGKYEIVAKIGQGAMGQVHLAYDPILDRKVAIKTMAAGVDADDELRRRFLREAQSAARLNHRNIITIYDFGEEQGHLYIAMELLEGADLKDAISRKQPMSLEAKLDLMDQICDGLAFAHARNVIHRDLKPANIHIHPSGQVTIVDFGLARVSTAAELTGAGMMLGTPNYMSPEQVRGEKATTRSDVFALGVVFYELLAGRKPFDSDSLAGVLFQVVQKDPVPLEEVRGELGPIAPVIQRALAKDPAQRFATAGELREALHEARRAMQAEVFRLRPPLSSRRATPGDIPTNAGTLVRPLPGSAGATLPAPEPPPTEATPVPAVTRRPQATAPPGPPTVAGSSLETLASPATAPTVALPSTPTILQSPSREPRPSSARPAPPPMRLESTRAPRLPQEASRPPARAGLPLLAVAGGAAALVAVGGVAVLILRSGTNVPSPPPTTAVAEPTPGASIPAPTSLATPPTTLPAMAPASTLAPPRPTGPSLADAERELREKDYRAALAAARSILERGPASPNASGARRLVEEAQSALRTADETAARFERAVAAGDGEEASRAFSRLVAVDPRRPDTPVLAGRLNELLRRLAREPPRPAPATTVPTTLVARIPPTVPTTLPPVVAPPPTLPPAPTTAPPVQSEAAARQAIRGVLDEYRAAFERRDADALRAVQPGVDYEAMKKTFSSVTGYTVRIDVKDVSVNGDEGRASCVVTYMPQPKPAQKIPPQPTVFHLRRSGDVWTIVRLERR